MVIRPAEPSDAEALSALALEAKAHWGYPPEWLSQWLPELTFTAEYLRARPSLVAIDGDEPVGVCVLEFGRDHASLEHLWVAPARHGRGIGRSLLSRALEVAARAGVTKVEVLSDPFAVKFYLKLGARQVGEIPAPMPGAPGRCLPMLEFTMASAGVGPTE